MITWQRCYRHTFSRSIKPQGFIESLVFGSSLFGMASVELALTTNKDDEKNFVEISEGQ
jgi:hypothetical protein